MELQEAVRYVERSSPPLEKFSGINVSLRKSEFSEPHLLRRSYSKGQPQTFRSPKTRTWPTTNKNVVEALKKTLGLLKQSPLSKFTPSQNFISKIVENSIKSEDNNIAEKKKKRTRSYNDKLKKQFKNHISEQIEGTFTLLVRYNPRAKQIRISKDEVLSLEFRELLEKCLDLDNYNLKNLWDILYKELSTFLVVERKRSWGLLFKGDNNDIHLKIDPNRKFQIISPK